MLSVIIPVYNEAETLGKAAEAVKAVLGGARIDFEIIFTDDGSTDSSWQLICREHTLDSRVRGIRFSRNFGKDAALFAGLKACRGDCAAVMDCDLQHPPEKLVEMYELWRQGYEVVEGVKNTRGREGKLHRAFANMFYGIMTRITRLDMRNASDFKLLDRKVINTLLKLPEHRMFFRTLSSWVGYKSATVSYDVGERIGGTSKWSTAKLFKYAVSSVTSFTTQPMQIVTWCGGLVFIISIILGIWGLVDKISGRALEGMTTVIFLLLFMGSIIMLTLGIIGYYIARIYEEVQARPRYIIDEYTDEYTDKHTEK